MAEARRLQLDGKQLVALTGTKADKKLCLRYDVHSSDSAEYSVSNFIIFQILLHSGIWVLVNSTGETVIVICPFQRYIWNLNVDRDLQRLSCLQSIRKYLACGAAVEIEK